MRNRFILDAAVKAGESALKVFRRKGYDAVGSFDDSEVRLKSPNELVGTEDIECQEIILDAIRGERPHASLYSEELDNFDGLPGDGNEEKYVIDPLDGTHNFFFGLPFWGVAIARLDKDNVPVAGVIHLPALGETVFADGGGGMACYVNGREVAARPAARAPKQAMICYDNQFYKLGPKAFEIYERLTGAVFTTRILGSAAADFLLTAKGRINGRIWNDTNPYDIAAGIAVLRAAGGCVLDFDGNDAGVMSRKVIACSDRSLGEVLVGLASHPQEA